MLDKQALLEQSLFIFEEVEIGPKGDMPSMEHPFFFLSPDLPKTKSPYVYEHNGITIRYQPGPDGLPTIFDKDLLIFVISSLVAGLQDGQEVPAIFECKPIDFFKFTGRSSGGKARENLRRSLDRLNGFRFSTNYKVEDMDEEVWGGLVESAKLVTNLKTKEPIKLQIRLSQMTIDVIKNKKVLTLSRDYFKIRKPLARRLYELARKHCGTRQDKWTPYIKTLYVKAGTYTPLNKFRYAVKQVAKENNLPDYTIDFDDIEDQIIFKPRPGFTDAYDPLIDKILPPLCPQTYGIAKKILAKYSSGLDVYALKEQWEEYWRAKGCLEIKDADKAFIGFCKREAAKYGPKKPAASVKINEKQSETDENNGFAMNVVLCASSKKGVCNEDLGEKECAWCKEVGLHKVA